MNTHPVIGEIHAYLERTGMRRNVFSWEVFGGQGGLSRFERSVHPRGSTIRRARDFMAEHPNGMGRGLVPETQLLVLARDVAEKLLPHAAARSLTVGALALKIVETTVDERMIDAVLDDLEAAA